MLIYLEPSAHASTCVQALMKEVNQEVRKDENLLESSQVFKC